MSTMQAWVVDEPGPLRRHPLARAELPIPQPGPGEVLVRVRACGVCRTDLHVVDGRPAARTGTAVVPGHEVVGRGRAPRRGGPAFRAGRPGRRRLAAGHVRLCRWCRAGRENLCAASRYTGWDADGGYAEYAVAPRRTPTGSRRLRSRTSRRRRCCAPASSATGRCDAPSCRPVAGSASTASARSAHLTAQVAVAQGAEVHVLTRGAEAARAWRWSWERRSVGGAARRAARCRSTPPSSSRRSASWSRSRCAALDRGGTLAVAGIHLSDVPALDYQRHLFRERTLRSVTANTRQDGEEFLLLAERLGLRVATTAVPMSEADRALVDLEAGRVRGAAVLVPASGG